MLKQLTDEQRKFAEENHDLVYAFLKENGLDKSKYYDVVIFGFLCAVQEYYENPVLQQYKFATIAWKKMKREVIRHYKYLSSNKRMTPLVSLQELVVYENSDSHMEDIVGQEDELIKKLEVELLLCSLASKLSEREMRIIRMKLDGAKMHDIAKREHITFHDIKCLLDGSYDTVVQVLLG